MTVRWTVLASGSSGNASLLECDGAVLLLDAGLSPRQLTLRMGAAGVAWGQIGAVLLTHTHADHWHKKTLAKLGESQVPIYCHAEHRRELQLRSEGFEELQFAGLVRTYEARREFAPIDGVRCRPLEIPHDGGPTFGFRLEGIASLFAPAWAVGYAADLGNWDQALAQALADVDLLALEFNHDVNLQRASGRAPWLIERVLGDQGHLSNVQGAQLLRECLRRSKPGRLRHVVQLHLSRECNRPTLAAAAARAVLAELALDVELHTAGQHEPGRTIELAHARSTNVA
jgi:phosphoribosyl 1,2-cyclic phosphodiesterase